MWKFLCCSIRPMFLRIQITLSSNQEVIILLYIVSVSRRSCLVHLVPCIYHRPGGCDSGMHPLHLTKKNREKEKGEGSQKGKRALLYNESYKRWPRSQWQVRCLPAGNEKHRFCLFGTFVYSPRLLVLSWV